MPLNANIGQIRSNKHKYKENKYLTEDQARCIYKKVELGDIIDINTMKQDITSRDINPYRELVANNAEKTDTILLHMEQWSILSNIVNYIQCDRYPKNFYI